MAASMVTSASSTVTASIVGSLGEASIVCVTIGEGEPSSSAAMSTIVGAMTSSIIVGSLGEAGTLSLRLLLVVLFDTSVDLLLKVGSPA